MQQISEGKPNLWLRDVCSCEKCVDPHSGQKSFATTQLDFLPAVRSIERHDDGSLTVVWANDPVSGGEDHTSVYPASIGDSFLKVLRRDLWDREIYEKEREKCRISYADWMAGGSEFWDAMAALSTKGLVFVYDVPEGDEQAVERIGEQIGALQETFYGRTWDVVSKPQAENVAYTNQFLGLHQDLLYYPDPPRVQLLHCLSNECEGGESLFSDGVYAAMLFAARRTATFLALTHHPTAYHYNKNGNVHYAERPVVKARHGQWATMVDNVWWSPPFQAPFPMSNSQTGAWYLAAKQFQVEIERPEHMVEYRLQPGECVVFDNWRVLHGRRQFNSSSGKRHLKGTYIDDATYRAKFEDMPAPLAQQHELWTNRDSEFERNVSVVRDGSRVRKITDYLDEPLPRAADSLLYRERNTKLYPTSIPGFITGLMGKGHPDGLPQQKDNRRSDGNGHDTPSNVSETTAV
jgi:gamma-butyrobetaine dioxygenase